MSDGYPCAAVVRHSSFSSVAAIELGAWFLASRENLQLW